MKLYVFGIGGTGSRVLRALTMLLASGVDCKADTIVPIIIDPDDSAADKTRTVSAMQMYKAVRGKLGFTSKDKNRFFRTELRSLAGMDTFCFGLKDTRDRKFREFIGLNEMSYANKAMANMLFSEDNLDSDMKVGFKGNPNIGSVVLNQFDGSKGYASFSTDFTQGDRIFIISSIFGGTGASGFPLLLKTFRSDRKSQSWNFVSSAKIGAVTVLPYFNLEHNDSSGVDSASFISKTKSALQYYQNNISANGSIDQLYYIGDRLRNTYENHDGGSDQKNKAHLVEFCAALSILNFAATGDDDFGTSTQHFEYGLEVDNDINEVTFKELAKETRHTVSEPMTQLLLMHKYLHRMQVNAAICQPWAKDHSLDKNFFTGDFFGDIKKFLEFYTEWLSEMAENKRAFTPFNVNRENPLFDMVNGYSPAKMKSLCRNYALMDSVLNRLWSDWNWAPGNEQQFIELFYRATKMVVDKKYNLK